MKLKGKLLRPKDAELELTFQMKVSELEELHKQLNGAYPSWNLSYLLKGVLSKIHQEVLVDDEEFRVG